MGNALAVRHGGAKLAGQTVGTRRVEKCGRRNAEGKREARHHKAKTEQGAMAFIPKIRWITPRNKKRRGVVDLLEMVEQCVRCPWQACTTMFFLIPKNVTSERPIALMLTVARCQKNRIEWDATGGRNGATVWETLLEMEGSINMLEKEINER